MLDRAMLVRLRDDLLVKRGAVDRLIEALEVLLGDDLLVGDVATADTTPAKALAPAPLARRIPASVTQRADAETQDRGRAEALYMQGMGPQEIADTLGIKIRRVDKWQQRGKWSAKRKALLQGASTPVAPAVNPANPKPPIDELSADKAKAKALFLGGMPAREIAQAVHRSMQHIYQWSSDGKWRLELEAKGKKPSPAVDSGAPRLRTAEELRAERKARDEAIINDIRRQNDAARRSEKVRKGIPEFARNGSGALE